MDKHLPDTSTGTIRIGHDSSEPQEGPRDRGFFDTGGGNGFSGGFGGSSRKRAKKRAKARAQAQAKRNAEARAQAEAAAEAQRQAQEAARVAAHKRQVAEQTHAWEQRKAVVDQHYAERLQALPMTLQREVHAATRPWQFDGPLQDSLSDFTSKAISELEGLIARKQAELEQLASRVGPGDGQDPASRLEQLSDVEAMRQLRQSWESAYVAGQEAQLLSQALGQLNERLDQLKKELARRQATADQYKERNTKIRRMQQLDEDWRRERAREANTLTVPATAMASTGMVLGGAGMRVASGQGLVNSLRLMQVLKASKLGPVAAVALATAAYSPRLDDGELTPEQRRRRFEGIGVPAEALGLKPGQDLQAIADVGGTAQIEQRLRIEEVQGATTLIAAGTGEMVPERIPVRNAVLDPVSNTYRVEGDKPTDKHLVFSAAAPGTPETEATAQAQGGLLSLPPEPLSIPANADLRFNDCIVCVPGQQPFYFSFKVPPVGQGMVHGAGQPAWSKWFSSVTQPLGAPIPQQVAAVLGGREFDDFASFERAFWLAVADDKQLLGQFWGYNGLNVQRGEAPFAPQATWDGGLGRYQVRYPADVALGTDPFALDRISIHLPNSQQGKSLFALVEAAAPWVLAGSPIALKIAEALAQPAQDNRTWTPLAPPGSELLGPTTLPEEPVLPGEYTGTTLDPILPVNEILPGVGEGEVGSGIPGYGDGTELPSPGLVFAEPVEPLETGEYDDMSRRSSKDGLDIDHIVSRKALALFLEREFPEMKIRELREFLAKAPSIAIPAQVHQKYSETYGGRNTKEKQLNDSRNLESAVNSNFDAIKKGLLEHGFKEVDIESARGKLHELHRARGWYE